MPDCEPFAPDGTWPSTPGEQELLGKIIEVNPYGILITDPQGRPVRYNQACVTLFSGSEPPPPGYCLFRDPILLRAGLQGELEKLRRGEAIAPIEIWYDVHELDPSYPSKPTCVKTNFFALKDAEGKLRNLVLMHQDITPRKLAESMFRRREGLLQAVACTAQWLLESQRWQECMERVLREIGQAVAASRTYLFEVTQGGRITLSHVWKHEEAPATWDPDQQNHATDAGPFGRWNQLLRAGSVVAGPTESFPEPERLALHARGIRSVLQIPIFVDGVWFGAIGFDDCCEPRQWSEGEVAALKTLAGLLGGTIHRQRIAEALQRTNDLLEARVAERTAELVSLNEELQRQVLDRRESEGRLRAIVAALPDLLFIFDEDGSYLDVLSREEDLFLLPLEELAGKCLHDVLPAAQADEIVGVIRQTIETGQIQSHEYLLESPARTAWFESRSAPLPSPQGGKRRVVWVTRDVTDRKQAEAALQESEAKYRTLVDNLAVGVNRVTHVPPARCLHANQACAQIFGYDSLEEFVALPLEKRFADPAEREAVLSLVMEKGFVCNQEVRIRRRDGSEAFVSSTARAHYDEEGNIDYIDGIIEDITERKQVEERLRLLSKVVEQTTEGIAVADINHRVLFTNMAFAAMHGLDAAEVIGQPVAIFHSPEQVSHAVDEVARTVQRTGWYQGVVWHMRKDGRAFPTMMTVSALRGPQQELIGYIGTALDITEQLEAESQRQLLAQAVETAGEGIAIFDREGTLTYANTALAKILGKRRLSDLLFHEWQTFFEPANAARHREIAAALANQGHWAGRLLARKGKRKSVPVAVTLARMGSTEPPGLVVANVRDQSSEEAHLAQIQGLTLAAAQALEEERAQLSRELHDELGQTLTAINLNLAWLSSRSDEWDTAARERLAEVQHFVNRMLDAVRNLSTSLRPPILDNRGLLEAVRSYAAGFARRAGFACRVLASPSDMEIHDPVATTVFRIFQEAMTNVARHSRAEECGIFLKLEGSILELKVRDNGVGAVPRRLQGVESLGIAGMRERAASVGGSLVVENRPEGGVCVTARLPWRQEQKRNDE